MVKEIKRGATISEAELDELEAKLRQLSDSYDDGAWLWSIPCLNAADAIAQLRRERMPREPTQEMCREGWDAMTKKQWLLTDVWQAMFDAAKGSPHD